MLPKLLRLATLVTPVPASLPLHQGQCSPQAVQPRPGPLGLAWLAGLVGLVLAPSRLGTNRRVGELDRRDAAV